MASRGEPVSGNLAACAFIERFPVFRKLERPDLDSVFEGSTIARFEAGEVIIREGDDSRELYIMQEGQAKVIMDTPKGKLLLDRLSRGSFFGEVALMTGKPRTATVVAETDVTAIVIGHRTMEGILAKYPKVRKMINAVVEARVKNTIEKTTRLEAAKKAE
ncbi:MAG: cyclic nucleotide-binding domain-containing protein [Deltaproteobacteria bacterium]|nr:MAG: cyclic nucleotide-binding domain-containing protein [Deltaproteobacteria bacterium]